MNKHDVITKVGGIDAARAIDGMLQKHSVPEDWKISIINGMWHRSSIGFTHKDLRAAIAECYKMFKVGDLVVKCGSIHQKSKSFSLWAVNHVLQTTIPCLDVTPLSKKGKPVHAGNQITVSQQFRHATTEEIAAGHRLIPPNSRKLETLEMIDVSPNVVVINERD